MPDSDSPKLVEEERAYIWRSVCNYVEATNTRSALRSKEALFDRIADVRENGFEEGMEHATQILIKLFVQAAGESVSCPVCGGDISAGYFECVFCASSTVKAITEPQIERILEQARLYSDKRPNTDG